MLDDGLYTQVKNFIIEANAASVSAIQREFRLQFSVATNYMALLEQDGIVSPPEENGARIVFDPVTKEPLKHALIDTLPIHTALFDENRRGSLLLCGINHGYSKQDEALDVSGFDRTDSHKSFFSDKEVNDYRMRNRIAAWFRLWGYPLQAEKESAGAFERSIIQTNWLQSVTNNVRDMNVRAACIAEADSFLTTCKVLKPRVIIFFSKELLWAFTSGELAEQVKDVFGEPTGGVSWIQEQVLLDGKPLKAFKVGIVKYENLTVISLPHPTGAQGLSDAYIAALAPTVGAVIADWWKGKKRQLAIAAEAAAFNARQDLV
ncbi:MAG: DNA translocase FtsK [Oxalicibacterium faecigallinarum]|uniref:DNA translocase FtsK n=1 Tax=Oxalicibacterium faecigallinarum TaxID=573741 RepID=UPI002808D013|nr:DNA translocase FtsK [Oxalicibacterium faecigallinarum]MDQ7968573.1 DNA translocase FtsK [Oxalicibacterium faecigallinarum]